MNQHRSLYIMILLVLFLSIALAACAPQNQSTPEVPTATVASASPTPPESPPPDESTPEIPTATVASASPTSPGGPLPVAAWDLDGDGAASIGDSALEFSGAYEFSDTAVAFDGYTGSGSTAAPGPIDTTASFSVSAWVNYADRISDPVTAVSQLGDVTGLFLLGVVDSGKWFFARKTEDRTGLEYSVRADGSQAVPSKSWTHLVGIYDKDAGMLQLYVNGEPQAEAAYTATLKANGPLTIGRGQFDSHPGNFWPGSVGEVAVYQAALTADQVAEIYQATKPSSPPPPMPAPDPSTYANGILNGTWDFVVSDEEDAQVFLDGYGVTADEVRVRLGFNNHQWYQTAVFDGEPFFVNGIPEGAGGTFRIEDDQLILTEANGQGQATYAWVLDGDQLTLTVVSQMMDPIGIMIFENTFTKSGEDGSY